MSVQAPAAERQHLSQAAVALLRQFPPRPTGQAWEATGQPREAVLDRLFAPPFVLEAENSQSKRRVGLRKVLAWLEQHPGRTWQERWVTSGADAAGNIDWRQLAIQWLQSTGWAYQTPKNDFHALGTGLVALISGEVIRPSLTWLLTPGTVQMLTAELARSRDPRGFAALAALSRDDPANKHTKEVALTRIATMAAAKGGMVTDITVGDCLEMASAVAAIPTADTSVYFYQMLHATGVFPEAAPPTVRFFEVRGQISIEQMIDRYQIECHPVRDLLVDYLRERSISIDYVSLRGLAYLLGKRFWKDLENHHPGIDSLRLAPGVATAWKQRAGLKKTRTTAADGTVIETETARADHGLNCLAVVRSFYGPQLLPGPCRLGDGGSSPVGHMGCSLSCPRGGDVTPEGGLRPQVPHGPANPRAPAGPARPDPHGRRRAQNRSGAPACSPGRRPGAQSSAPAVGPGAGR